MGKTEKERQSKTRTTTISIRLTPEQLRKVKRYAFDEGIDMADLTTPAFLEMWGKTIGILEPQ